MAKNLIIYYSRKGENYWNGSIKNIAKGNTEIVAEFIQKAVGGDLFEVDTVKPYSTDYTTCTQEAQRELRAGARPELKKYLDNIEDYDNIFVCGPCWWGQAPKIMYTFVESCNLSGKTVIPFCTSGSSSIGTSAKNLQAAAASQATWLDGRRFAGSSPRSDVENWISGLGI